MAAFVAGIVITGRPKPAPPPLPTSAPTTVPSTAPATEPAAVVKSYIDVVRATYPSFPATQPLAFPTNMGEAARLVINDPIFLERLIDRGDIWITRPDAPETSEVLKDATKEQVHVTREHVAFSHWSADDKGEWRPSLICRKADGSYEFVSELSRHDLPRASYDWERALSWNDLIVVPSEVSVHVFNAKSDAAPDVLEFYPASANSEKYSPPRVLEDARGLIAWMPWENGKTGSRGAARYSDGKWTKLDSAANWPEKIVQLIPLRDGSIVQLVQNDDGSAKVALSALEDAAPRAIVLVNSKEIEDLIERLSAPDQKARDSAFAELSRFGPGAYSVFERLLPTQSPAAQVRIKSLLKSGLSPTLGGMSPLPGPIQTVSRSDNGGAVFYLDAGITMPGPEGEPQPTAPAWLALRPGRAAKLLSEFFTADLQPGKQAITSFGDEWIVTDDAHGPRRFMENHFQPMLKKREKQFSRFVGFDRRGRWYFKTESSAGPTLITDPTLPDATPRLPVWEYPVKEGKVGWTAENWPVIENGGAWVLTEKGWRPIDKDKEKLITEVSAPAGPATESTTEPSSVPTTHPETPILTDTDGTKYYDGLQTIRIVTLAGRETVWPLPAIATGSGDVWFFHAGDNRFFLFNEPGRILRLKRTPEGPEAFRLEATFTKNIPNSDLAARIWLDPAGRIIIAHNGDTLSILFPGGQIPNDIAKLNPTIAKEED